MSVSLVSRVPVVVPVTMKSTMIASLMKPLLWILFWCGNLSALGYGFSANLFLNSWSIAKGGVQIGRSTRTQLFATTEFRLRIQGTKNAYTTVKVGDVISYRLDQPKNGKEVRLGAYGADGKLYPLCNRIELGSEFFIDTTAEPISVEELQTKNRLLRVVSSDRRSNAYIIEEYLDSSIYIPVVDESRSNIVSNENEVDQVLTQISSLNHRLAQLIAKRGGSTSGPSKIVVESPAAPRPVGPYSQAIKSNGVLYVSGCIGLNIHGKIVSEDVKEQTKQALENLGAILKAGNSDWNMINKVTIFTTDINQFSIINSAYLEKLKLEGVSNFPARSTIEVSALPLGAKFEIEAMASYRE